MVSVAAAYDQAAEPNAVGEHLVVFVNVEGQETFVVVLEVAWVPQLNVAGHWAVAAVAASSPIS